jgi:uncharacterized repeat protein (TIGR03803 family)
MHPAGTDSRTKAPWNISHVGPRIRSPKLAAVATRGALTLAVLSALLLMAARPAEAQTETVLYNFTGGSDGYDPSSNLTFDGDGNLYGTTIHGGPRGFGTVYELSPNGNGGWNETTLYGFCSMYCADGSGPNRSGVIFDNSGNLYGTTYYGGANGNGVVFELSPVGGSWTETVLYNFCSQGYCTDGGEPQGDLIMDPAGNLYGTNSVGVFELSPSDGGWTEQIIYHCCGLGSLSGLTMDAAGNIFGTEPSGVFELSPNGNGGWIPTVIHTFTGHPKDGSGALGAPVFDKAGNLYGTTTGGGTANRGTVYKLSPGEKGWTEAILYNFRGTRKNDGSNPEAGIAFDGAGNIYGTTLNGGEFGEGTVFELVAPVGTGKYKEKVLLNFANGDGAWPWDNLVLDSAGNLYGTAIGGGLYGNGVVFEVAMPSATMTTLTSSPNPSTYGQAVTFTAVVTPAPPDGETVTFMEAKTPLGTGTLSGGSASFTTSTLRNGTTTVTAVYGGDAFFVGSTSNKVKQVVKRARH